MARLEIAQIRAPDLSVASQAMARSGDSFRQGMSSASDLLGKYQEGMEASGDAELTNMLAQANNADEWDAIVANTDFNNMNLSAAMRETVINRTGTMLGFDQSRADIRGTDASTGLTVAQTGTANANTRNVNATAARTVNSMGIDTNEDNRAGRLSDFNFQGMQDTNRAGAASVAAQIAGRRGEGNGVPMAAQGANGVGPLSGGPGTNAGPRADGSGLRMQNNGSDTQIAYRNGIAAIESDGSGGYSAIGATDPDLGRALGRYQIMEANISGWSMEALGREVSADEFMASSDIQDAIFDHKFAGYVEQYGEEGAAQAWFGGDGGVGKLNRTDVHGVKTIGSYGETFLDNIGGGSGPNRRVPVTTNQTQSGPAATALNAMLSDENMNISPAMRSAMSQDSYDANQFGLDAIAAADKEASDEFQAGQLLKAASGNTNSTDAIVDVQNDTRESTNVAEVERQLKAVEAATQEGGILGAERLKIGLDNLDSDSQDTANTALASLEEEMARDPFQFSQNAAVEFEAEPVESLTAAMKNLDISTTPSEIESAINQLATDAGITRAQAAYSFARAAEDNSGPNANGWFTLGGDNLSQNKALAFANENFAGNNGEIARAAIQTSKRNARRVQDAAANLTEIQQTIQKLERSGQNVPGQLRVDLTEAKNALDGLEKEFRENARANRTNAQNANENPLVNGMIG